MRTIPLPYVIVIILCAFLSVSRIDVNELGSFCPAPTGEC